MNSDQSASILSHLGRILLKSSAKRYTLHRKMRVTRRMRILKTAEVAEIVGESAKKVRVLRMVEFADFAERNPERMRILKVQGSLNVVLGRENENISQEE